jgi:hypothetical protein
MKIVKIVNQAEKDNNAQLVVVLHALMIEMIVNAMKNLVNQEPMLLL